MQIADRVIRLQPGFDAPVGNARKGQIKENRQGELTMSEEPRRGWGMATIPNTAKGECDFSRETPLGTYDCVNEKRMRAFEPKLYPGEKFLTHRRCTFQHNMRACPSYVKATPPASE
jgi:hypothetical protein